MKYQLCIFDLDGTVLNTLEDLADATNSALAAFSMPSRTVSEVRQFVGNGIRLLVERAVPRGTDAKTTEAVLAAFHRHYAAHMTEKTTPYEGILPLLRHLRERGILTAVLSNKADYAVKHLANTYFPQGFDYVAGEKEGIPKKPNPAAVFAILQALQVDASRACYIGDSDVDVKTAAAADLSGLFVTWGFRTEACLRESGAHRIFHTPKELETFLLA